MDAKPATRLVELYDLAMVKQIVGSGGGEDLLESLGAMDLGGGAPMGGDMGMAGMGQGQPAGQMPMTGAPQGPARHGNAGTTGSGHA